MPWAEYFANELNLVFKEHGLIGEPGRIEAQTIAASTFARLDRAASANSAQAVKPTWRGEARKESEDEDGPEA